MYYIKKYADCWAVHNDDTGKSRPITEQEKELAKRKYPALQEDKTLTVYFDDYFFENNL